MSGLRGGCGAVADPRLTLGPLGAEGKEGVQLLQDMQRPGPLPEQPLGGDWLPASENWVGALNRVFPEPDPQAPGKAAEERRECENKAGFRMSVDL